MSRLEELSPQQLFERIKETIKDWSIDAQITFLSDLMNQIEQERRRRVDEDNADDNPSNDCSDTPEAPQS